MRLPKPLPDGYLQGMKIFDKIDAALDARGLTQAALERLTGLAENRISKWKDGKGYPDLEQARRIAKTLDVPLEWLADDAQDWPPPRNIDDSRWLWLVQAADVLGFDEIQRRILNAADVGLLAEPRALNVRQRPLPSAGQAQKHDSLPESDRLPGGIGGKR